MKTVLGIKKGMMRVYKGDKSIPVTVVDISGCKIVRKDANGIEIGIGKVKGTKQLQGKYKDAGFVPAHTQYINGSYEVNIGDAIKPEEFSSGLTVSVTGVSKGKGFAGVVKRHGFHGGPKTHGQSDKHRSPGAIGAGTTPGRIYKGTRMSGRMGGDKITMNKREIVDVVENYLLISGPIPGAKGSVVTIFEK